MIDRSSTTPRSSPSKATPTASATRPRIRPPATDARSAAAALRPTGSAPQPRYPPANSTRGCVFNRRDWCTFNRP
jgi:hypothetical protein